MAYKNNLKDLKAYDSGLFTSAYCEDNLISEHVKIFLHSHKLLF